MDLPPRRDPAEGHRLSEARAMELEAAHGKPAHVEAATPLPSVQEVLAALEGGEVGLADLAIALLRGRFCFVPELNEWREFRRPAGIWRADVLGGALPCLRHALGHALAKVEAHLKAQAAAAADGEALKQAEGRLAWFRKATARTRTLRGLRDVLTLTSMGPDSLAVAAANFDRCPTVLGTPSGLLDLETGMVRGGLPDDYVSMQSGAEFHGLHVRDAAFDDFLDDLFGDRPDTLAFIAKFFGSAASGHCPREFLLLLGRSGSNGKSLLLDTLSQALGDYAFAAPASLFLADKNRGSGADPVAAQLPNKRFLHCSETPQGKQFDSERAKILTGADAVTVRGLYSKPLTYKPVLSLAIATNHPLRVGAGEDALWRRARIVELRRSFVDSPGETHERQRDPGLPEKLSAAGPAVLAWLCRGYQSWSASGFRLDPPEEMTATMEDVRLGDDSVAEFIVQRLEIGSGFHEHAKPLAEGFAAWHEETFGPDVKPITSRRLWDCLAARFSRERQGSKKTTIFRGVRLKP